MALLALQCLSEAVRRIAFLRGVAAKSELEEADLPPLAIDRVPHAGDAR
jgi:hypothetical protein